MKRFLTTITLLLALFASASACRADALRVFLHILEAQCGPGGKPMSVCDAVEATRSRNPFSTAIDAEMLKMVNRYRSAALVRAEDKHVDEFDVQDGVLTVSVELLALDFGRKKITVVYRLDAADGSSSTGRAELVASADDGPIPIVGEMTSQRTDADEVGRKTVRVMWLELEEGL